MPATPRKARNFGKSAAHQRLIMANLAASLFGIRAAKMLGVRDDADAAAFASGLLIGSDVAARLAAVPDAPIFILSGPELGNLYTAAIAANGRSAALIDSGINARAVM